MSKGFVIGVDVQPLTVNTYLGTQLKSTLIIQNDWVTAPSLYFPELDITWTATIVSGQPNAAYFDVDADHIAQVPNSSVVELRWDNRVMARGAVKRKGS